MKSVKAVEPKSIATNGAVFNLDEPLDQKIPELEEVDATDSKPNWFGKVINKSYRSVKEFFEASPDSEF